MDDDGTDRSIIRTAGYLFAWSLAASLASYVTLELIRRYHHHLDHAIDGLEAETNGAIAKLRRVWRLEREARRQAPYVVWEAIEAARDAANDQGTV